MTHFRKSLTALPMLLLAGAASAQDWAGRYWGGELSFGAGSSAYKQDFLATSKTEIDASGGMIGAVYGRNWQTGNRVWGYEADLSIGSFEGSATAPPPICSDPGPCSSELSTLVTLRGRIGLALDNGLLPFATAGLAVGQVEIRADEFACDAEPCATDGTKVGIVVGGGVEYPFRETWNLRGQVQYINLGEEELDGSGPTGTVSAELSYIRVNLGFTRRF